MSGLAMPTVDVPLGWSTAEVAGGGAVGVRGDSLLAWWRRFDDPLLADLVNRALLSNPSIASAQAAMRQAQALRDVTAAALLPTLDASASAQTGSVGGDGTGNQFQLGMDAQWAPDFFGGRRDARDAADAVVAATAASLGDTQVQVAAMVATNYILLRSLQMRWGIASDNLVNQQDTRQITDWRQQAGLVTTLEVEQARAATAQTQALLPALQTSIDQTTHALAVLTGQPPTALQAELGGMPVTASSSANKAVADLMPTLQGDFVLSIPAETLRQRADVRATEHQVAAALARVSQAEARRWPSFAIGGSIGVNEITVAALTSGASVLSSLLASVSLPVLDGGALRAQVRAEQAALAQTKQAYRAAVLTALKDVEGTLAALRGDRLRLTSLQIAAQAAGNAALLARQRYSSGLVDFQTVLETQRNQLATQDSVVGARADLANDQVRLFTALGGGWRVADNLSDAQQAATR